MNKQSFLDGLRQRLTGLPQDDVDPWVEYYGEMIDDRVEEGMEESEAVASLGTVEQIVSQIMRELPLKTVVGAKMRTRRRLRGFEIAMLILGFPLWFPLLVAAVAVGFSVYAALWSVVLSLYAVDLSFAACGVGGMVLSLLYGVQGNGGAALFILGASLLLAGLTVSFWFVCLASSKGMVWLGKKMACGMKYLIIGKERRQ